MSGPALEWSSWEAPGMAGALFQHATEALVLVDPLSERVLDANEQACALSELTREELLGLPLRGLLRHEQEWQDWPPLHEKAFAAKDGFLLRTRNPDRWIEVGVRINRVPLPGAGLTALVALHDRREHVDLVRRLQRAEAELRGILVSASDCLWSCSVDAEGRWRYRYLSPTVQRLTGRNIGAFLDDPWAWEASIEPEDLPAWRAFRERLVARGSGAAEYRLRRPSGPGAWVHENVLVSRDEGGLILSGVVTDISERKREEKDIRDRPRERLDAVASLAGALAHDFNNLFTGILGHVSLARAATPDAEGLGQIEAITLRAADLCKQLVVVGGKSRSGGQTRDLAAVVRQALEVWEHTLLAPRRLHVDLPRDLPVVAIDEAQVRQLVEILARNAGEATEASLGEIFVRAWAGAPVEHEGVPGFAYRGSERSGAAVWIEVRDTGPGIPTEALARLGEPFASPRPGNRGMGLAVALGILRGHGGGLEVYTTPGRGTVVRVMLPAASLPLVQGVPASVAGSAEHRPTTVLLVDDEESVRDVAARLLRSVGCEVVTTTDGEEAIDWLSHHAGEVGVALVDLTMPRLSGEPLLREMHRLAPELPIVLMSGYAEGDIAPRVAEWGLAGYLQKPFRLPVLLEVLRRVVPAAAPRAQ